MKKNISIPFKYIEYIALFLMIYSTRVTNNEDLANLSENILYGIYALGIAIGVVFQAFLSYFSIQINKGHVNIEQSKGLKRKIQSPQKALLPKITHYTATLLIIYYYSMVINQDSLSNLKIISFLLSLLILKSSKDLNEKIKDLIKTKEQDEH